MGPPLQIPPPGALAQVAERLAAPSPAAVAAYLDRAARTPFAWGRHDCCLWLADWLVALGRPDPAAPLRGRYASALGAARILNRRGGVLGLVAGQLARIGLQSALLAPGAPARPGDIAVVNVATDHGLKPAGAICAGRRWAVLGQGGLIVEPLTPLAAWRV